MSIYKCILLHKVLTELVNSGLNTCIRHENMSNENISEPDQRVRNLIAKYNNVGLLHHATAYTKLSTIDLGNTSKLNKVDRFITEKVFNNNSAGINGEVIIDSEHEATVEKEILAAQRQLNMLTKQLKIKNDASIDNSLQLKDRIEITLEQICQDLCKLSQPKESFSNENVQFYSIKTLILEARIRALNQVIKGQNDNFLLPTDAVILPSLIKRLQTQISSLSSLRNNLLDRIEEEQTAGKFDNRLIKELDQIYKLSQARRKKFKTLDKTVFHNRSSEAEIFQWIKAEIDKRSEISEQESRQLMRALKQVIKEHIGPFLFENVSKFPPIPLVDTSSATTINIHKRLKPLTPFDPKIKSSKEAKSSPGPQDEKTVTKSLLQLLLMLLNDLMSNDNEFVEISRENELAARLLFATEVAIKDGTKPFLKLRPFSD